MTVFLTIAGLDPKYGGPSQSVPALAESLARAGAKVTLITCEAEGNGALRLPEAKLVTSRVLPHSNRARNWRATRNGFFTELRTRPWPRDSIIHDNGLWLANNHAVAVAARKLGGPRMVSPRGMLSAWAMRFKGMKKRLAWWLYQRRDLRAAKVLHATSRAEAAEFRAMDLNQPIAVIPNGVELPPLLTIDHRPRTTDHHTLLFLSRVHQKKGLKDLVRAWSVVRGQWPNGYAPWRVVIAGGGDDGYVQELKAESRKLKVETDFEFVGSVEGDRKWDLYRQADLFVLPSHSENFGIVVAEALACGVPVITTRGTPWEDLVKHRCGWWTEIGSEPLAAALGEATALSDEARHEMGRRAREWMEREFSWSSAAQEMMAVYAWMLGNGVMPKCIRRD